MIGVAFENSPITRRQLSSHFNNKNTELPALAWSSTAHISALQWLAVPVTLVFFNLCIYLVHRHLGHHKHALARLFYARHTGDHHSFFTPGHMTFDSPGDWRVILFPAWLIVLHSLAITLRAWWLLQQLTPTSPGCSPGA